MSGGVTIQSSSAIEVDPESLRAAAARFEGICSRIQGARAQFLAAEAEMDAVCLAVISRSGPELTRAISPLVESFEDQIARLRRAADLYELTDLLARISLPGADVDALEARAKVLVAGNPVLFPVARALLDSARARAGMGVLFQALGIPLIGGYAALAYGVAKIAINVAGYGRIPPNARLLGPLPEIQLRPTLAETDVAPPTSLEEIAERIPNGPETLLRVERYKLRDGTNVFFAYITGTREIGGSPNPFDVASDLELYGGEASASYAAVQAALKQMGAKPGDVVMTGAHSQGAMAAEWLAQDQRFQVKATFAFGTPVQATVSDETLHVVIQHDDDLVTALQGTGMPELNGAPNSFIATRTYDPLPQIADLAAAAHQMDAYIETAKLVDASDAPQVIAMEDMLAQLRKDAVASVTVKFSAEEVPAS